MKKKKERTYKRTITVWNESQMEDVQAVAKRAGVAVTMKDHSTAVVQGNATVMQGFIDMWNSGQ